MKSTWRLLNEVFNNKKSKNRLSTSFKVDNMEISDPVQIANHFCEYFSDIVPNLAKSIPPSYLSHRLFLSGNIVNSLSFLKPTIEQEVAETCCSFRSGTSAGYDDINMNVVKDTKAYIIIPLTCIINLSLANGTVPDQLKIARVIPLFKSGTISLFTNYRPVYVLPAFSTILERMSINH